MSHTPMPWDVYEMGERHFYETNHYYAIGCKTGTGCVAKVEGMGLEPKANAYIMAAAPDLLATLEAVPLPSTSGECESDFCRRFFEWWESHAKPAINKAKGTQ